MGPQAVPFAGPLLRHRPHYTTAGYDHRTEGHLLEAAETVGMIIAKTMTADMLLEAVVL